MQNKASTRTSYQNTPKNRTQTDIHTKIYMYILYILHEKYVIFKTT